MNLEASDGHLLAFQDAGTGSRAVVFLHGLTANSEVNWTEPGIAGAVAESGWRTVLLDARGHGQSGRSNDPRDYGWARQGQDVVELLDHLDLQECVLIGYSLGAGTAAWLTPRESRVRGAVLAGVSAATIEPWSAETVDAYVEALLAPHGSTIAPEELDKLEGAFGSSVAVSIANIRALGEPSTFPLSDIAVPVMVLNGVDDSPPDQVASLIPGAIARSVPGNHGTAPLAPEFTAAITKFLDGIGS